MRFILLTLFFIISCKEKKTSSTIEKNVPSKIIEVNTKDSAEVVLDISKDFVLGKFNYRQDTSFIKVSKSHSSKTIYLKKEVYHSFIKMYDQAKSENINLKIISGTRNFYEQKAIWERKWGRYKNLSPIDRAKKILEYSSMPSTSRHHWGTDLDLNNLNNSYFEKGRGAKEYDWLIENANAYGFYQVYTSKEAGRKGYNLEKWHWSYIPLSEKYLKFYNDSISFNDIKGFKGAGLSKELDVVNVYVNGISKQLIEEE
ncbi:MAG: M15 family metallopeptidase [Polaribacter sp.]